MLHKRLSKNDSMKPKRVSQRVIIYKSQIELICAIQIGTKMKYLNNLAIGQTHRLKIKLLMAMKPITQVVVIGSLEKRDTSMKLCLIRSL